MKNNLFPTIRLLVSGAAAAVLLGLGGGAHAQAYVNATVGANWLPVCMAASILATRHHHRCFTQSPSSSSALRWWCPVRPSTCTCRPAMPRTGASIAHATTPAASRCILCRSRLHAAATRTAGPMAGTTAAGTMTIATMTAMTTIAVPGAEKAVARAMDIGTKSLYFAGFAPAQRRGPHLRLSSGLYGPSLLFSPFHPTG